jgi:hypothetical protein
MIGSSFPTHCLISTALNAPGVMGRIAESVMPAVSLFAEQYHTT